MAVLDFPDPTQPSPTVKTGATDDLLSQLAGDEIDRLLAEPDAAPPDRGMRTSTEYIAAPPDFARISATNPVTPNRQPPASPPSHSSPDAASSLALPPSPSASSSTSREAGLSAEQDSIASPAELIALLDTLSASDARTNASSSSTAATLPEPAGTSFPASATEGDSAAIVAAEIELSDAERMALRGSAGSASPASFPSIDVPALDDSETMVAASSASLPLLLRPLAWLNAPFAGVGDETRDTIGRIALITLINAMGVLIYVFFFRRR